MDKEKRKIFSILKKFFEEKGYETDNIDELEELESKKQKRKLHSVEKISNLKEMLNNTKEKFGDKPFVKYKTNENGIINAITYKEFIDDINSLGTQLINIGLKNKKIAVIGENRYEWAMSYLAICCGTGVVVPLDKSLPANEIESLIIRSGVEAIFYSSKYNQIMEDIKQRRTSDLRYYISMDLESRENGIYSQKEFIKKGKELIKQGNKKFLKAKINTEEMNFMLFTSGTTAMSKAVMLSHKNICANLMDIGSVLKIDESDVLLSFLPLHHTFECTVGFLYAVYKGTAIAYCEGIRHIAQNIKEYQVTAMISVPALYENMYKNVLKSIEKKGKLPEVEKIMKLTGMLSRVGLDIRKRMFKEIHDALGGKLRLMVNGAAALDAEVEKGFGDLGFKIIQGYGLTETSPVIAAGTDFESKIGSVGKIFPNVKVKIIEKDEDGVGEIWVKGPSVMIGYYQNEEANKEIFEKGWLKTGDLGCIDKKGFLFLRGRKKSVIVLKNGKNVYPEEIENVTNRIEGIKESFIYGKPEDDNENYLKLCVKIVYDKELMNEIYKIKTEEEIKSVLWKKIKEINKTMPPYKYIKELIITEEPLIKTTTLKIKRYEELKKIQKNKV
ncbi:MAG: AMP-binding protein [Clostridia bacterium]|nr:AMP-binding protein [Clostridia bacterium]